MFLQLHLRQRHPITTWPQRFLTLGQQVVRLHCKSKLTEPGKLMSGGRRMLHHRRVRSFASRRQRLSVGWIGAATMLSKTLNLSRLIHAQCVSAYGQTRRSNLGTRLIIPLGHRLRSTYLQTHRRRLAHLKKLLRLGRTDHSFLRRPRQRRLSTYTHLTLIPRFTTRT